MTQMPATEPMKIGFAGIGRMGGAMASRLLQAGHFVTVYDPQPVATQRLATLGASVAGSTAELCAGRDAVISMLADDAVLESGMLGDGGVLANLPASAVNIVCGTHGVEAIGRLVDAFAGAGRHLAMCPVLGRPDRAAVGELGAILGGSPHAVAVARRALAAVANRFFETGEAPLGATVAKIANNMVLGAAIEAIGEGVALTRRHGVAPNAMIDILVGGLFDCQAYRAYGSAIANEAWTTVGAAVAIGLKDAQLAFQAASAVNVPLPSCSVWRDHLISVAARGGIDLDWSAMAAEQFRRSGLQEAS